MEVNKKAVFELGVFVKDVVSGFKGFITAHTKYLGAEDMYLVTPKINDQGEFVNPIWFCFERLELIGNLKIENNQEWE